MLIEAKARLKPVNAIQPRPLAIVGFGPSSTGYEALPEDVPVWTMNDAENYGVKRITRAFEMHPIRDVICEGLRWRRLLGELPYPVYMLEADERMPRAVRYPIEMVREECFSRIFVGEAPACYLDSSVAYMLALGVIEGYNPIFIYGVELKSDTEYAYQRVGMALLIGWAAGRGVSVVLPEGNALLPPTLYGYEDYQMISRQNLEQFLAELTMEESDWLGKLNVAHTQVIERGKVGGETAQAEAERAEAYKQMYMRSGAVQAIGHLIDLCDRKTAALAGFQDLFKVSASDGSGK